MSPVLLLVASYLLGAVPTSYIVGRLARGIDLREHGSCNLGATNAFRVLGGGSRCRSCWWTWQRAGRRRTSSPVGRRSAPGGRSPTAPPPCWASSPCGSVPRRQGRGDRSGCLPGTGSGGSRGGRGLGRAGVATRIVSVASIAAALVVPVAVSSRRAPARGAGDRAAYSSCTHTANVRRLLKEEHRLGRNAGGSDEPPGRRHWSGSWGYAREPAREGGSRASVVLRGHRGRDWSRTRRHLPGHAPPGAGGDPPPRGGVGAKVSSR